MPSSRRDAALPDRVHFVTYTTRYNHCFWLTVDALDQHYERAEVDGTRDELTTRNIAALTLDREGSSHDRRPETRTRAIVCKAGR